MNRKTLLGLAPLAVAVFALGSAPAVLAQTPEFDELDADGDGYISRSEAGALPCLAEVYDQIETESLLGLNRGEYAQAVAQYC